MREIIVNKKYNNKKLCNFILDMFPNLNKNVLFKALRKKDIRINGIRINSDCCIKEKDKITLYITDELLFGNNIFWDIVYEDENILVVSKPENLSVTENINDVSSLTNFLKEKYGESINPCHRIDRNTKGLVLFAKNAESLKILLNKFRNQEIEKHYFCKVFGVPKSSHKVLEAYLFKDSKKSTVYISDIPKKGYLKIITEYTILYEDPKNNISYLDVNLHTGKTHQIRAHLAYAGFPILGDGKYGNYDINKKLNLKTQELYNYSIKFNFKTYSGQLEYLKGKEIKLKIETN